MSAVVLLAVDVAAVSLLTIGQPVINQPDNPILGNLDQPIRLTLTVLDNRSGPQPIQGVPVSHVQRLGRTQEIPRSWDQEMSARSNAAYTPANADNVCTAGPAAGAGRSAGPATAGAGRIPPATCESAVTFVTQVSPQGATSRSPNRPEIHKDFSENSRVEGG